jgi:response regulator RpfG family c-di-GMP phosphodiesterase
MQQSFSIQYSPQTGIFSSLVIIYLVVISYLIKFRQKVMNADVLIIDDDIPVLHGLRRTFREDYNIETAENGAQALKFVANGWTFKVIICDQRMQGIDGVTTLSRLKKDLPSASGILLTGHADISTLRRAINEAGVLMVIEKPCRRQILEEAIIDGLKHHEVSVQQTRSSEKLVLGVIKMIERILVTFDFKPGENRPRVLALANSIATQTKCAKPWEMQAALMMSDLNQLPLEADRLYNRDVDRHERLAFANDILAEIPRLSHVGEGLYFKDKNFDGTGLPNNLLAEDGIPAFGRALHVIFAFERLIDQGLGISEAILDMRKHPELFDPSFTDALANAAKELIETSRPRVQTHTNPITDESGEA